MSLRDELQKDGCVVTPESQPIAPVAPVVAAKKKAGVKRTHK